jgi:hypothetical protein
MTPILLRQRAEIDTDLIELSLLSGPLQVFLEAELLFDGHRVVPASAVVWGFAIDDSSKTARNTQGKPL